MVPILVLFAFLVLSLAVALYFAWREKDPPGRDNDYEI